MIIFRFLFALLGFYLHRPFGTIPGFIFGYAVDEIIITKLRMRRARQYAQGVATAKFNQTFIKSTFGMFAKMVERNGGLNQKEKQVVDRIINESLRLNKTGKQASVQAFNDALKSGRSFNSYAIEFSELTHNDPAMITFILDSLLGIAAADGLLEDEEKRILKSAADVFGIPVPNQNENTFSFNSDPLHQYESTTSVKDPYEILGCKITDSDSVIKQQYRRLASDYHPDKILAKELPEEFTKFANYKFNMIRTAYEIIRKERGMK